MASTVCFFNFLCSVNSQNYFFVSLKSVVSISKHFCVSMATTSIHCNVSITLLCSVLCGVHIPVKSSKTHLTSGKVRGLNEKSASFWYYQPLSEFFLFLINTVTSIGDFLNLANRNCCFSFAIFLLFLQKLIKIFLTMLFAICTLMCTSTLVGSCTDSVPSICIRLAILTEISWNKFKNHMVSTWKLHGVHMETTWYLHRNHMVSTWKPCGVHVVNTLCPHWNHMMSIWKPCFVHIETMWFSYGNHMVSTFDTL